MSQIHGRRDKSRTFTDDELHRAAWPKNDVDRALKAEYHRVMDEELAERREDEAKREANATYEAADYPLPWRVVSEASGYSNGQDHICIRSANNKIVTLVAYPPTGGWYRYQGVNKGIAQAICDAMNNRNSVALTRLIDDPSPIQLRDHPHAPRRT